MSEIHLLYGTEPYLIEERQASIIKKVLDESENISIFDCKETPIQEAIIDAQTTSLFDDHKVVIVKDVYFLTSEKDKSGINHDLDMLLKYIENPNDATTLILICPYEKLDGRKKLPKLLMKKAVTYEAKPLSMGMIGGWIKKRVQEHDVKIEADAAELLGQLIGSNLTALVNEIKKLALFVGDNGVITPDHVRNMVTRSVEQDVFMLVDRVINRKLDQALEILTDLFKQNEEPIKILALLASQFRLIYQINLLAEKRLNQSQIAKELDVHPYRVKLACDYANNFDTQMLEEILNKLADLDYKMKTGKIDRRMGLELFLASIAA